MQNFIITALLISMFSCTMSKEVAEKKEQNKNGGKLAESLQQKKSEGIDFFAKGSLPASWNLEIEFDKIIRFKSLDGTDYKSSPAGAVEDKASNTSAYTTKAGKGNMVITIFKESCRDALSNESFDKRIVVEVDGKRYEGCGQYLFDANLEGKWILDKISSRSVDANQFAKGLPVLFLELASGKVTGHDGCNDITGTMEVMGNRIKFSPLGGTKMACPGNKKENEFIHKLNDKYASYFFKDGMLNLYLIDDSIISFRKA